MIVNIIDCRDDKCVTTVDAVILAASIGCKHKDRSSYINDCGNFVSQRYENIQIVELLEKGVDLDGSYCAYIYDVGEFSHNN